MTKFRIIALVIFVSVMFYASNAMVSGVQTNFNNHVSDREQILNNI